MAEKSATNTLQLLAKNVIAQAILDFTNPGSTKTALLHYDSARDFLFSDKNGWAVQRKMWLDLAGMAYLTPAKIKEAIRLWKKSPDYKRLDDLVTKLKEASGRRSHTHSQRSSSSRSSGRRVN